MPSNQPLLADVNVSIDELEVAAFAILRALSRSGCITRFITNIGTLTKSKYVGNIFLSGPIVENSFHTFQNTRLRYENTLAYIHPLGGYASWTGCSVFARTDEILTVPAT